MQRAYTIYVDDPATKRINVNIERNVATELPITINLDGIAEAVRSATQSEQVQGTVLWAPDSPPVKILADGTRLDPGSDRTDHVAVEFADGTMIHVASLGTASGEALPDHQACVDRCAKLSLLGHEDWTLASRDDWTRHVLDVTRHDPAVDPSLFPGIKAVWHWTSTPAAWSSASAWYVYASYGYVDYGPRGYSGFALAVRRAGQ